MTKIEMNAAEAHRLEQARQLLLSLGFMELKSGGFRKPSCPYVEITPKKRNVRRLDPEHPSYGENAEG